MYCSLEELADSVRGSVDRARVQEPSGRSLRCVRLCSLPDAVALNPLRTPRQSRARSGLYRPTGQHRIAAQAVRSRWARPQVSPTSILTSCRELRRYLAPAVGLSGAADRDRCRCADLARSWSASDGGKTLTFRLNPAAKFSNGKRVTASDAAFSINYGMKPSTNWASISSATSRALRRQARQHLS